jgi:hypothetical protein
MTVYVTKLYTDRKNAGCRESPFGAKFSLLNEAEIIKLALSEVHNKEMGSKMEQEQTLREAFKRALDEGGKRGDELLAQKGIKRENMTEQQIYDAFIKPYKGKS